MTLPQRAILSHGMPPWVRLGEVCFLTICYQTRGENQLCVESVKTLLFEVTDFRQRTRRWYVHLLLLMPDHLHALASFLYDVAMKAVVANFKENTSKHAGIVWRRDFFDHRLRSDASFEEKAHSIRMNPVRQGLVALPELGPYCWQPSTVAAGPAVPLHL